MKYGGNTPCLEVMLDNSNGVLIFDAGTGIRQLGIDLMNRLGTMKVFILLTHFHWDHLQGIPFFTPLFSKRCECTFIGCDFLDGSVRKRLHDAVCSPYFPVGFDAFKAKIEFADVCEGEFRIDTLRIELIEINHPGGAVAFRIKAGEKVLVYMTDNELSSSQSSTVSNQRLIGFCKGVDLLIHDAQYAPEEYASRKNWGHSSYVDAVHFALSCGAKQLVLFHHAPEYNDEKIDDIVKDCHAIIGRQKSTMECIGAREGFEYRL